MLPSKGFFNKNDCPFFEKGLCIRPHCHFRHRKKVTNDYPSNAEVAESKGDEESKEEYLNLATELKQFSEAREKKPCSSTASVVKEQNSPQHDTLFAKLVHQTNTYEKMNRHIPCPYTPTPQTRNVQAKSKPVSAIAGFANSEKSLELITKARMLLKNYCAENIKKYENKSSTGSEKVYSELSCDDKQSSLNEDGVSSYEKHGSADKPVESNGSGTCIASSIEVGNNSECIPRCDESNSAKPYVGEVNEVHETKDGNEKLQTNVLIGEKSDAKSSVTSSENDCSELDLIASEIEMMKKLLQSNGEEDKTDKQGCEEKENKIKDERKGKSSDVSNLSSHHSSSSKHKYKDSKSSSSSRSRHSSSHSSSSRHSRSSSSSSRHHSSSSRHQHHHLSSSSRKSSHRRSSSRHSRDRRKERHSSDKGDNEKKHSKDHGSSRNKDNSVETHVKSSSVSDEDEDDDEEDEGEDEGMEVDNVVSDGNGDGGNVEEDFAMTSSRKRKNSVDEELQNSKYLSLSSFDDVDDDPDTVEQECLEIFNSYSITSGSKQALSIAQDVTVPAGDYECAVQGKKRTAHSSSVMADHSALRHKTAKKSHNIKSAQELMYERYKISEKAREAQQQQQQQAPNPAPILGLNKPSVRIAAVSNIQQMLMAKKKIQEKINQGIKVNERTTIAQTVAPGSSRVAHVPKLDELKEKPTVTDGSKQVPRVKRQTYVDKLLIETCQIFPTKAEAAEEALKLEQEIFRLHSGSAAAYHAAFVSLLMKTRRRAATIKGETTTLPISPRPRIPHADVLAGGKKNFSVIKTKKVDISMLTDKQIYEELLRCKLTPEELKENGFPVASDRPGYAVCTLNYELKYNGIYQYIKKMQGNRRYCIRCSKMYDVEPNTLRQYKEGPETCSYHPGRKKSGGRNCERIYNCCNTSSTEGCATHVRHVTDTNDYENFPNCVRTLAKEGETDPGVFALDCEMVYTRLGSELARVTVVNLKKEIVYDTLVKPKYPVDCYNTFYSGIEEKMMEGVETTLKDVQAVLLSMFSNKTILIGHSLDSDLRALHLIHDTVVDTSVVYKNERYYPYKYSLKDLCAKKISKIIQENVNGHDSSEDAIAALEIMLHHVKQEVARFDSLESYEADRGR